MEEKTVNDLMKNYGIGITGGIATGKSFISKIIRTLGYPVFDADIIARKTVEKNSPTLKKVVTHFGEDFLKKNGELDRRKLRKYIFQEMTLGDVCPFCGGPNLA